MSITLRQNHVSVDFVSNAIPNGDSITPPPFSPIVAIGIKQGKNYRRSRDSSNVIGREGDGISMNRGEMRKDQLSVKRISVLGGKAKIWGARNFGDRSPVAMATVRGLNISSSELRVNHPDKSKLSVLFL
jgi:hypothetical protein